MAIAPLTVLDTFSRTTASGLGVSDSGHTWHGSANASVNAGAAYLRSPANGPRSYYRVDALNQAACSSLTRFKYTSDAAWPLTDFGPTLLHSASNSGYGLAIQGNYSEIAIIVFINGYRYEMNRKSFSLSKDQMYWVRFEVTTTGVRARLWEYGTQEPTSWTIASILWDGSYPPTSADSGFFVQGTRDTYIVQVEGYAFYTLDEQGKAAFAHDLFNTRTVYNGWGYSDSGHTWEGAFSDDPEFYGQTRQGFVQNGTGYNSTSSATPQYGILGIDRSEDIESFAQIGFVQHFAGVGTFRLGLRGKRHRVANKMEPTGYAAQIDTGSDVIKIIRRTSPSAGWATLASSAPTGVVVDASTTWYVRIQVVGTTLRARYWKSGATEPSTWQVTTTDGTISSGRLWVGFDQSENVQRQYNLYAVQQKSPTHDAAVIRNFTTTGNITISDVSDTSIKVESWYEDDVNNNNIFFVGYRESTVSEWTMHDGTVTNDRTANKCETIIEGLQPDTTYIIQSVYVDTDGIEGPNSINVTHTTSSQGIVPQAIAVTSVTDSSIGIEVQYEKDEDDTSSAIVQVRRTNTPSYIVQDYFTDEQEGTYLQNVSSVRGGDWEKHPAMTPDVNAIRSGRYFYVNTESVDDLALYMHTELAPLTGYQVEGTFLGSELQGRTGIALKMSDTAETYYGFGIDSSNRRWEFVKVVNGFKTIIGTKPFSGELDQVYSLKAETTDASTYLSVNGERLFGFYNDNDEVPETGRVGYYSTGIVNGTSHNQFRLNSFTAQFTLPAGDWVDKGIMTPNRANKTLSKLITGLDQDTVYTIYVSFTDNGGLSIPPYTISAMTSGSATKLVAVGATTYPTSVIIDTFYDYDVNNNSYISVQYKSTMDFLWTTLPIDKVRADRITKKFSTTLAGLRPSTTYEVRVTVTDPDGLMQGSPETLVGLFTTKGFTVEEQKQRKHYLWKVYDPDGNYINTIPDAPIPEYSSNENGGVTDLTFTLHRKMSDYESQRIINYQNIVDVWCVDPSSDGMGPNLIADPDCDPEVGGWILQGEDYGQNANYINAGPDDSSCIVIFQNDETEYETSSMPIIVAPERPLVIKSIARARGAKLRMYARAYDINDVALDSSSEVAETVGTDWQNLRIEYVPPRGTAYIRVLVRNAGRGAMWVDKFSVHSKEVLVYRGRIESYTPNIDAEGETVEIEVLGLASLLSDDYIEFLQFVEEQPQNDVIAGRLNYGAKDPADMFKKVIDEARQANPFFSLYYTNESIRYTGNLMQYTIKDQQIRSAMDKIRSLCPSGWHYIIDPDGLVSLRGPEHAPTHILRIGIEITEFSVEKSIRNLKNYIRVKGRQDEDKSEPDQFGSINYIAFDQASIDKYGKRALFVRDAQLVDPESAKIVGDGRLDEHNREEQRARAWIPDEKSDMVISGSLKGYNIESIRAGDNVIIMDPIAGPRNTYWDQFNWDEQSWDISNVYKPLPESVPVKTIKFHGSFAELELSERPPSSVGDFSKMYRWMANKDMEG